MDFKEIIEVRGNVIVSYVDFLKKFFFLSLFGLFFVG